MGSIRRLVVKSRRQGRGVAIATVDELSVQISALNRASGELTRVARDIQKLDRTAASNSGIARFNQQMDTSLKSAIRLGVGFVGVQAGAAAIQGAFRGTVGAAIAFESSFAGIRKTVDETEEGFKQIADANRAMARELPTSVNEINRIGEAAGALGVSGVANLTKFERVMVDISNTTNLTSDEAATAFAQIANVLQLPIQNVDRLGSAIVDLGNKGASTEADIVAFSQRIAGAGKIAGLSAADIAGIGSAFASVGVEAEAGGTAIQKVLIALRKAAVDGGDELEAFAETAGLSIAQFQNLAKSNAAEAFTRFVEGLGNAGDEAFAILERLGLEDQRLIRSFLSTAQAGDLLRRSIETGNTAFEQNTALATEAEKRYSTTAAQLQVLQNRATDFGISLGQQMLPALNESAQGAVALIDAAEPLAPALAAIAKAAPIAAAGLVAFSVATKAASFAQLQGDLAVLTRAGFPNLAAQVRGNTSLMAGLGAAVKSPLGGFVALTAATVALDQISRKVAGAGLIDILTGQARAAREAARFTEEYGNSLDRIAARERAGLSPERARSLEVEQRIREIQELSKATDELRKSERLALDERRDDAAQLARNTDDLKKLREQFESLNLTVDELKPLRDRLKGDPEFLELVNEAIRDQISLLGAEAGELNGLASNWSLAVNEQREFQRALRESDVPQATIDLNHLTSSADLAAKAYDELQKAVASLDDVFNKRTSGQLALELEAQALQATIDAFEFKGLEPPAETVERLKAVNFELERMDTLGDRASLQAEKIGLEFDEAGKVGAFAVNTVKLALNDLPNEQRIAILTELDELSVDQVEAILKKYRETQIPIEILLQIREERIQAAISRIQRVPTGINATPGGSFAEGGFVDVSKRGELAMLHGKELILPLDDKKRSMELLQQAGMRGFENGGFTFEDYVAGRTPTGTPAGSSGAAAGFANEFAELARQIAASGKSAVQFVAELELYQEQQSAVEEAQRVVNEAAARNAIDLTKLSIALGDVPPELFILQTFLQQVGESFRQAGQDIDAGLLAVLQATGDFSQEMIQIAASMKAAQERITGRVDKSEGYYTQNSGSGVLTKEGYDKLVREGTINPDDYTYHPPPKAVGRTPLLHSGIDYVPRTGQYTLERGERVIRKEENRAGWSGTTINNYGPQYTNNYTGPDRTMRMGLR